MLANGITLGYKEKDGSTFTNLKGLQEVPEIGIEAEKVEVTCLADKNKQYENGIGDLGDLEYKFLYENSSATSPYRIMRKAADEGKTLTFEHSLPDGTKFGYEAQVGVKVGGGGVNGAIQFTLKMTISSDITVTDPATAPA